MALCKAPPTPFDLFFQAEQLGASPIEKCTNCKTTIKDCRICNSETSVLSATEIEEYNIMKDHCIFNEHDKKLHVRYPFSCDPSILIDNSSSAFNRQIAAERKQLKNGVHAQYVEQFNDMIERCRVQNYTRRS